MFLGGKYMTMVRKELDFANLKTLSPPRSWDAKPQLFGWHLAYSMLS